MRGSCEFWLADCCSGAPKKIIWNRFLHALNPNSETTHFLYSYRRDQATLKSPIFTQNRDFSAATSSYYYSITNLSKRDHNCDTTQKARNFKCEKKSKYGFCYNGTIFKCYVEKIALQEKWTTETHLGRLEDWSALQTCYHNFFQILSRWLKLGTILEKVYR